MQTPRNPHLFEALSVFVGDALSVIRNHDWGPDGLPARAVPRIKIDDKGMTSDSKTEIDWSYVLFAREKELQGLSSYSAMAAAMRADPAVAKHLDTMVGDGAYMARVDIISCIRAFLLHLLVRKNGLTVDAGKLNALYAGFEDYFHSDHLKKRAISPLTNFEMEADQVELGPGFLLRRLSLQEREAVASSLASFIPFPPYIGAGWPTGWEKFTLDLLVEVPKVIGERPPDQPHGGAGQTASERFQTVISALRLFKTGAVDLTSISTSSIGWDIFGGFGSTGRMRLPILGTPYTLSMAEGPAFVAFWTNFKKQLVGKHKRVDLAMRRFNLAYERLMFEDRLIDYMIGLEALLLRSEEQQELGFRLALRGSRLLGHDPNARSGTFSRLRSAYSVRSEIVHGGSVPAEVVIGSTRLPFNLFVDAIADDVRAVMRKMLELTETTGETQIISSLDDRIVRGDG